MLCVKTFKLIRRSFFSVTINYFHSDTCIFEFSLRCSGVFLCDVLFVSEVWLQGRVLLYSRSRLSQQQCGVNNIVGTMILRWNHFLRVECLVMLVCWLFFILGSCSIIMGDLWFFVVHTLVHVMDSLHQVMVCFQFWSYFSFGFCRRSGVRIRFDSCSRFIS